jgi:hypothetical protein
MTAQSVKLWSILNADQQEVITEVREQLAALAAKVVLLHLAIRRRGDQELAEARLQRLARSLQHASEDARAVERAVTSQHGPR